LKIWNNNVREGKMTEPLYFYLPETIINMHAHGRGMRQSHKATMLDVLAESRAGKIDITGFMPNTWPAITNKEVLDKVIGIVERAVKSLVLREKQSVWFGATDSNLKECENAFNRDEVVGIKVYSKIPKGSITTTGGGGIGVAFCCTKIAIMNIAKNAGKPVAWHCADPYIMQKNGGKETEEAVLKDVELILKCAQTVRDVKIVFCHIGYRKAAEMILDAQKDGINAVIELCPHYLWFDNAGTNWTLKNANYYKCFNNLGSYEDREFLISLLQTDNDKIIISSDHAPHTKKEKLAGAGGFPTVFEMVPVIITLAKKYKIPEKRVAELLSFNAAKIFNIKVPTKLVKYRIEERRDDFKYSGKVVNPWQDSWLYFPMERV